MDSKIPNSIFTKDKMLPSINLTAILIVLLISIGLMPMIIAGRLSSGFFMQSQISAREIEVQNSGVVLAGKMTRMGYMNNTEAYPDIDNEMNSLADAYNGRMVVINSSFRIIKDTFKLAVGKTNIAEEVIGCFRGNISNKFNSEKKYIVQTIPIYKTEESDDIDGVLLITSSTEYISDITTSSTEMYDMITSIFGCVIVGIAVLIAIGIVRPFKKLNIQVRQVAAGNLHKEVTIDTYTITKQISSSINDSISKLKDADKSRDEFVANVSHELKTPITSMRVLADSIMSTEDAPAELYRDFMKDISGEIDRESKIIDDLLTLVKLDKAEAQINIEQVDINMMLENILKRLRPIAKLRNIELSLETQREVVAEIDETKMTLAITNLVENGVKYNNDGGWVKVMLNADHRFCYIKVCDSGVGIPEELREAVFERFYRVDKARSRETGGTGLGLAITKNIILMHGGIIKIEDNKESDNEGCAFFVRIPLAQVPDKTRR